jgi:hypothetical protein
MYKGDPLTPTHAAIVCATLLRTRKGYHLCVALANSTPARTMPPLKSLNIEGGRLVFHTHTAHASAHLPRSPVWIGADPVIETLVLLPCTICLPS